MPFALQNLLKKSSASQKQRTIPPCPCSVCKCKKKYSLKVINRHLKVFGRQEFEDHSSSSSSSDDDQSINDGSKGVLVDLRADLELSNDAVRNIEVDHQSDLVNDAVRNIEEDISCSSSSATPDEQIFDVDSFLIIFKLFVVSSVDDDDDEVLDNDYENQNDNMHLREKASCLCIMAVRTLFFRLLLGISHG